MRKALLVDGPRAGAVVSIAPGQTHFAIPVPLDEDESIARFWLSEDLGPGDLSFRQEVYTLHPGVVWLFGLSITIGSVRPGRPRLEDLIEFLLSDEAKEALS